MVWSYTTWKKKYCKKRFSSQTNGVPTSYKTTWFLYKCVIANCKRINGLTFVYVFHKKIIEQKCLEAIVVTISFCSALKKNPKVCDFFWGGGMGIQGGQKVAMFCLFDYFNDVDHFWRKKSEIFPTPQLPGHCHFYVKIVAFWLYFLQNFGIFFV